MPGPGRSTFGSALPSHSRSLTPVLQNRSDHLAPRLFYKCGTYGTGGGHDVTNITENSRMETAPPGAPLSVGSPQTAARPRGDGGSTAGQGAVPAAAAAHSCCSHTGPTCPASGSHVSAAAAAALPSASFLPAGRTATKNK